MQKNRPPSHVWPPIYRETTLDKPLPVPYLENPPEIVDITIGRQLFVDNWLVEETSLHRIFHQATIQGDGPVFTPQTLLEQNGGECPCACPFNDGIFYDDQEKLYKMWYQAGWFDGTSYAQSEDGIHWERLHECFPGRNERMLPREEGVLRDGGSVWLDFDAKDPRERYKMLMFFRKFPHPVQSFLAMPKHFHDQPDSIPPQEEAVLYRSANGIDWERMAAIGPCGDNTTFHLDPFRKKWVFSLRTFSSLDSRIRTRGYVETEPDRFFTDVGWKREDVRFWSRADLYDEPDPLLGHYPQLYNLDGTPYESLMLGVFGIFLGEPNYVCEHTGNPKMIDLKLSFSRDGFHWHRPSYQPFLSAPRTPGAWNGGYLHTAGGVCLVVGDTLRFYFSAWSGASPKLSRHMYAGGSVGLATLRRDGFASLTDQGLGGHLVTRLLRCKGDRLFVNSTGMISAEILDENMRVLPGFSREDCLCVTEDRTKQEIRWRDASIGRLDGRPLRVRFILESAALYSFWITHSPEGRSGGFMAAGGPGFAKGRDLG